MNWFEAIFGYSEGENLEAVAYRELGNTTE